MPNLIYNPVIDLGAVLIFAGILLAALRGVRRFAWLVVLGAIVGVGGWLLPVPAAEVAALMHFPKPAPSLQTVPVSEIKAIASGKAPADELTPQYVASLKLHSDTPGFNSFNGAANAIANSPMAHNAKWVAETAVLAELEGNDMLANALGYSGSGVVGARPGVVLTGVRFQASFGSVQPMAPVVTVGGGPTPPQVQQEAVAAETEIKSNFVKCSPTIAVKTFAYSNGSSVSASGITELARAGSANDPLVGCNQNLPFRVTLLHLQIAP